MIKKNIQILYKQSLFFHSSSNCESMSGQESFEQSDSSSEEESNVKQKKITSKRGKKTTSKAKKKKAGIVKISSCINIINVF